MCYILKWPTQLLDCNLLFRDGIISRTRKTKMKLIEVSISKCSGKITATWHIIFLDLRRTVK